MSFQAVIVTSQGRETVLERSLSRLAGTDWGAPPRVQVADGSGRHRTANHDRNVRSALEWFRATCEADFLLLLDDALEFNSHLRWNVERWSPLLEEALDFGSLCRASLRVLAGSQDYYLPGPESCSRPRACLLSRKAVQFLLQDWGRRGGPGSSCSIERALAQAGCQLYHHCPCLVRRVAPQRLNRRRPGPADFSCDWRCDFSHERIPGWFTFPKLYRQAVAEATDGDVLVEIGAWLGRSTAFLGRAVKTCGKRVGILVIDTFEGSKNEPDMLAYAETQGGSVRGLFERNMRLADVADCIEVREGRSVEVAQAVPDRRCSFVFIDGDHRYEALRADIRAWRKKVRPGGILAGHDCYTYAEVLAAVKAELGSSFVTTEENVWVHRAGG